MGLGVGLIDAIGGAADGYLAVEGPKLQAKLQAEADAKKAKILNDLNMQRDAEKAKQKAIADRRKQDADMLKQAVAIESADTRARDTAAARSRDTAERTAATRFAATESASASRANAGTSAAARIEAQRMKLQADRKKNQTDSGWSLPGLLGFGQSDADKQIQLLNQTLNGK